MNRTALARMVDHTLLKPEATDEQVRALIEEAVELGAFSVCLSPSKLPVDVPDGLVVCTVVGFPSGAHHRGVKSAEAELAVDQGAGEVDMVLSLGDAVAGDWQKLEREVRAVRQACGDALLKVIIESAALTDEQVVAACRSAEAGGAQYVKTSTGFHPTGGASVHAVRLMRDTVGERLGVKASGGIRDTATALAMVEAGASRLGLSGTRAVLGGLEGSSGEVRGQGRVPGLDDSLDDHEPLVERDEG